MYTSCLLPPLIRPLSIVCAICLPPSPLPPSLSTRSVVPSTLCWPSWVGRRAARPSSTTPLPSGRNCSQPSPMRATAPGPRHCTTSASTYVVEERHSHMSRRDNDEKYKAVASGWEQSGFPSRVSAVLLCRPSCCLCLCVCVLPLGVGRT